MKTIIVANWKMNPVSLAEAMTLLNSVNSLIKKKIKKIKNLEIVICPPFAYLPIFFSKKPLLFELGAQDCFWEEKGAFTGEICPLMLKSLGCQYVILGHSERRRHLKETDEMINRKIKMTLSAKLRPILCVGETWDERKENLTQKILKLQIEKGLKGVEKKNLKKIIIAYEPVWAIGTGKACSPDEAEKGGDFIRKVISRLSNKKIAKSIQIIYGGSVNSQNAAGYIFGAKFQGLLPGGASLDVKEFSGIIGNFD